MTPETRYNLIRDILGYLECEDNLPRAAYAKARLYSGEELLGEAFNLPRLALDLLDETDCIDLFSEEAGGAVPVDITQLDRVEPYIG